MAKGEIDIIAYSALFLPLNANIASKKNDIKIFSVGTDRNDKRWFGILTSPQLKLNSLKDLEGKKLGSLPGPVQIITKNFLTTKGVDVSKIEFSTPESPLQGGLLIENKIDALITFEPNITDLTSRGANFLSRLDTKSSGVDYSFSAGFVSNQFITKNPELARKTIQALDKGIIEAQKSSLEVKNAQLKYVKTKPEIVAISELPEYLASSEVEGNKLQKLLDYYLSTQLIKGKLEAADLIYKP